MAEPVLQQVFKFRHHLISHRQIFLLTKLFYAFTNRKPILRGRIHPQCKNKGCYEAKIQEIKKGWQPLGVEPRTPGLSRQCSATELRQPPAPTILLLAPPHRHAKPRADTRLLFPPCLWPGYKAISSLSPIVASHSFLATCI